MIPFYITCYNSPALTKRLVGQLDDLVYSGDYHFILSDQSEDKEAEIYQKFAESKGFTYLRYENKGASQAKRSVLAHALASGAEFCHQISEDFIRVDENTKYGPVTSGKSSFDTDALAILKAFPELGYVKWNIITCSNGDMAYLYRNPKGTRKFECHPNSTLPFITGDVCFSNWPGTWRVKAIEELRVKSLSWSAPNQTEDALNISSGGEWAMSECSFRQGACLVAQPFHHPDRIKPSTSLP